jgi:Thioredoxin.
MKIIFSHTSGHSEMWSWCYIQILYASRCGHCKNLHPIWEELADMLNDSEDSRVTIGQVDCTVEKQLCADQEITGYPT